MPRLRAWVRDPEVTTDLMQIGKSVIAATAAWWLSGSVLDSQMPFLAPWTALLTVHATVHRSLSRGIQTTVATTIGVGIRSEEHTSELQSRGQLVCRLLLEKKK